MKGMKGKLPKKLKTIRTIGYLNPIIPSKSMHKMGSSTLSYRNLKMIEQNSVSVQEPEIIDVSDLMKDLEDEEMGFDEDGINDKENIRLEIKAKDPIVSKGNLGILSLSRAYNLNLQSPVGCDRKISSTPLSKIDISSFWPPDFYSGTLFDPNLLAAFEQAIMEVKAQKEEKRTTVFQEIKIEEVTYVF